MKDLMILLSLLIFAATFGVLWQAYSAIERAKQVMLFAYDMLEAIRQEQKGCCCHDCGHEEP